MFRDSRPRFLSLAFKSALKIIVHGLELSDYFFRNEIKDLANQIVVVLEAAFISLIAI